MDTLKRAMILALLLSVVLGGKALAVAPGDYGLTEGNVISAAGSDDPDVYIVNEMGYKRLFLNPAIFGFYGHLGGFAAVKNVTATTRDAFPTSGLFRNCETNDEKVYGVETTGEDVGMLHWVNTSGAQAVADDPNFFKKVFCINNNEFAWYAQGTAYTSVNQVPNYVRGTTPVVTGPLSASLAMDNPPASTLVANSAMADLAHFNVNGSGAVTNVEFKRLGVSGDTTLSAVYLFVNGVRVSDSGNVSTGMITFTNGAGLFTAPATVVVKSNILTGTQGQTVGVQLTKLNTSAVAVSGNIHSIATAVTLGTVTVGTPTGPGNFDPQKDVTVWQSNFTVANEDVYLKRITLREVGSVNNNEITNLRLLVDGVQVATAAGLNTDGYVTFLANQRMLQGSRVVKVVADVIGGAGRTMQFQLKGAYDLEIMDEVYNVLSVSSGLTSAAAPTASTLGSATLTVVRATDSPSADVVNDAKNVLLAKYTMTGYGEAIKIETMRFFLTATNTTGGGTINGLDNGRVVIGGQQYGSTTDLLITEGTGTDYTVNYTLQPGVQTSVEVYGDIQDSTGNEIDATDALLITFDAADNNFAQGVVSANNVDVPHTSTNVDSLTITVAAGSMTAGKYTGYANQTIVAPKSGFKFGHFTLTSATSEDVNVNTLDVTGTDLSGSDWNEADITDMYVKVLSDTGATVYTSAVKSTVSATASNSYSVSFSLPKGKVYQVEVWGNISSTDATNGDAFRLELDAAGVTADSGTTADLTRANGQSVTAQSGQLTVANGAVPVTSFVQGGLTKNVYQFTVTPAYDDYMLDEVYVDIPSVSVASNAGAVVQFLLKDGGTTLKTATLNSTTGSASFTGLGVTLLQSAGTKTYAIEVQFANVGAGANDTAGSVTVRLDGMKYKPVSGGAWTTDRGYVPASYTGNAQVLVKGYPTFANQPLDTTVLSAAFTTLFKTKVTATGAQVSWNDIVFQVSSNSGAINVSSYKLYENGVDITPSTTSVDGAGTASTSQGLSTNDRVEFNFATERIIGAGGFITLELKGTVAAAAANNSLTTQIPNSTGSTVTSEDVTTQTAKTASFIWSDQSNPLHSTTSDDWFTDGLLKTIAESQTLSK